MIKKYIFPIHVFHLSLNSVRVYKLTFRIFVIEVNNTLWQILLELIVWVLSGCAVNTKKYMNSYHKMSKIISNDFSTQFSSSGALV